MRWAELQEFLLVNEFQNERHIDRHGYPLIQSQPQSTLGILEPCYVIANPQFKLVHLPVCPDDLEQVRACLVMFFDETHNFARQDAAALHKNLVGCPAKQLESGMRSTASTRRAINGNKVPRTIAHERAEPPVLP